MASAASAAYDRRDGAQPVAGAIRGAGRSGDKLSRALDGRGTIGFERLRSRFEIRRRVRVWALRGSASSISMSPERFHRRYGGDDGGFWCTRGTPSGAEKGTGAGRWRVGECGSLEDSVLEEGTGIAVTAVARHDRTSPRGVRRVRHAGYGWLRPHWACANHPSCKGDAFVQNSELEEDVHSGKAQHIHPKSLCAAF